MGKARLKSFQTFSLVFAAGSSYENSVQSGVSRQYILTVMLVRAMFLLTSEQKAKLNVQPEGFHNLFFLLSAPSVIMTTLFATARNDHYSV